MYFLITWLWQPHIQLKRTSTVGLWQPNLAEETFHYVVVATILTLKELLLCVCHNYVVVTSRLDPHTESDVVVATTIVVVLYLTIFYSCDTRFMYLSHIHRAFSVQFILFLFIN